MLSKHVDVYAMHTLEAALETAYQEDSLAGEVFSDITTIPQFWDWMVSYPR